MFKGVLKYWVISITCGLMAAALCYIYLGEVEERYRPDDLITVVKAAQPIAADEVISRAQLMTEEVPARYAHPNGVREVSEVVGKMSSSYIAAGEEIIKEKLVGEKEKASRLAYSVPLNKRAVAIAVNETAAVSFQLQAGDHVDVMVTMELPVPGSADDTTTTMLLLQDIEILSVGTKVAANNSGGINTLTLAVTPEQAQPLILAGEKGVIRLLLRSPVDESQYSLPGYTLKRLTQP